MNKIISLCLFAFLINVQAKFHQAKIDYRELKCLVCQTTLKEFRNAIELIDPTHKMDVGGYRLDAKGNIQQKTVTKAKSEVHLSEIASGICETMDNYIRGTWKDDGSLTILKLIENGQMSSKFSQIDIIQDDDLNKSLKYYCEEIVEGHEDNIIKAFQEETENIIEKVCMDVADYCKPESFIQTEHFDVPGTENDFVEQLNALNQRSKLNSSEEEGVEENEGVEETEDEISEETGDIEVTEATDEPSVLIDDEIMSVDVKEEL